MKQSRYKKVVCFGYEFDSIASWVRIPGRGQGGTLAIAARRAVENMLTNYQLKNRRTTTFLCSFAVVPNDPKPD